LVWVLGFASESDLSDLQDDIQRAHQVAEEADAAVQKEMRSISTTLVEVVHVWD
jgi:predicted lipid-binding transport protein (Tim44 family)